MSAILISGSNKIADILIDHFETAGLTVYRDADSTNYKKLNLIRLLIQVTPKALQKTPHYFYTTLQGLKN